VVIKRIGLEREKVSELVKGLARLVPKNRENLLHWKTHYFPELSYGDVIGTLRPGGDAPVVLVFFL